MKNMHQMHVILIAMLILLNVSFTMLTRTGVFLILSAVFIMYMFYFRKCDVNIVDCDNLKMYCLKFGFNALLSGNKMLDNVQKTPEVTFGLYF